MLQSKSLYFAIFAMLASLFAVCLMEPFVLLLPKNGQKLEKKSSVEPIDILLSIDVSGSMSGTPIEKAREAGISFIRTIEKKLGPSNMSKVKITLVKFDSTGDVVVEESSDPSRLIDLISALHPQFHFFPTNGIFTFEKANDLLTSTNHKRYVVTLTDGKWSQEDHAIQVAQKVIQKGIISIAIGLKDESGVNVNELFLERISSPNQSLTAVTSSLETVFVSVANNISTLQGSGYDAEYANSVNLVFILWSGVLSYAIAFMLIYLQNRYLKKEYPLSYIASKVLINFVMGCIAYLLGEYLFTQKIFASEMINRLIGWLIMGAMIGVSVSKTVPNYAWIKAIQGGWIGGILGGIVYQIVANMNGDFLPRLLGAMALGFFIGLMIAIFEKITTDKQLIINWGPKDTSYVSLGSSKVLLASHLDADVFLPKSKNPEGHSYSIYLENQRVYCENLDTYEIFEISKEAPLNLHGMQILIKY